MNIIKSIAQVVLIDMVAAMSAREVLTDVMITTINEKVAAVTTTTKVRAKAAAGRVREKARGKVRGKAKGKERESPYLRSRRTSMTRSSSRSTTRRTFWCKARHVKSAAGSCLPRLIGLMTKVPSTRLVKIWTCVKRYQKSWCLDYRQFTNRTSALASTVHQIFIHIFE